jgi:hypothetical protein
MLACFPMLCSFIRRPGTRFGACKPFFSAFSPSWCCNLCFFALAMRMAVVPPPHPPTPTHTLRKSFISVDVHGILRRPCAACVPAQSEPVAADGVVPIGSMVSTDEVGLFFRSPPPPHTHTKRTRTFSPERPPSNAPLRCFGASLVVAGRWALFPCARRHHRDTGYFFWCHPLSLFFCGW